MKKIPKELPLHTNCEGMAKNLKKIGLIHDEIPKGVLVQNHEKISEVSEGTPGRVPVEIPAGILDGISGNVSERRHERNL